MEKHRKQKKCFNCGKSDAKLKTKPNRTFLSPNPPTFSEYYCNESCKEKTFRERYVWFAELDRNASDSECFEHDHWEKDSMRRSMRVGKCKITGKEVRVEPLQPGDNSGQPVECYQHFELKKIYK